MKTTPTTIRKALKIDPNQRIAQYLYNLFREYEKCWGPGKRGLAIWDVSDEVFTQKINEGL